MSPRTLGRLIIVAGTLALTAALALPGVSVGAEAAAPVASDGVELSVTIPSPDPTDDPTEDPTDDPTATDEPTPTPTARADNSGALPATGPAVLVVAALGVVLLLVGVAMRIVGRRRHAS